MTKPQRFILNSDYATLKNDDSGTLSVTIPGSMSRGTGTVYSITDVQAIGQAGSTLRANGSSSRTSIWYAANQIAFTRTGTVSGSPATYTLATVVYRSSATELTLLATIFNPYASTLTTQSGSETITFNVRTFLSPYA